LVFGTNIPVYAVPEYEIQKASFVKKQLREFDWVYLVIFVVSFTALLLAVAVLRHNLHFIAIEQ
jgi:hypothetical protein